MEPKPLQILPGLVGLCNFRRILKPRKNHNTCKPWAQTTVITNLADHFEVPSSTLCFAASSALRCWSSSVIPNTSLKVSKSLVMAGNTFYNQLRQGRRTEHSQLDEHSH